MLQQNAMRWNNRLKQAIAVCNGLAFINKTVVGIDMEQLMFKAVEARFLVGAYASDKWVHQAIQQHPLSS